MTIDQFKQVVIEYGIEEACKFFGYKSGDVFIERMKRDLAPLPIDPINSPIAEPVPENVALDLSRYDDYIQVWTDGACSESGNANAVGGYGAVLVYRGKEKPIWGFKKQATSIEMKLWAVAEALKQIQNNNLPLVVFSSSDYIIKGFSEKRFVKWQENGWKSSDDEPIDNKSLWEVLIAFYLDYGIRNIKIEFVHVPANSGLTYTEKASELAKKAVKEGILLGK